MSTFTGKKSSQHLGTFAFQGVGDVEFRMCGECGIVFGALEAFFDLRRQDGEWWQCPNGHSWHWSGEPEATKLKRQLAAERDKSARLTANLDQTTASLRSTKGVVTKLKKRTQAGVCPAGCRRHFSDLQQHMASKHPDFAE